MVPARRGAALRRAAAIVLRRRGGIFRVSARRRLARAANIVPVDPDANLVSAMQAAAAGLRLDKVLILFPEGERSIDGTLKPFRKGAAILASHPHAPVIPVALDGLYELWPRGRPLNWRLLASMEAPRHHGRVRPPLAMTGNRMKRQGPVTALRQAVEREDGSPQTVTP